MKAIVQIGSQQLLCEPSSTILVNRLAQKEGEEFDCKKVLWISDDTQTEGRFGAPYIPGASVRFQILRHLRGNKIIVFKKRSKKAWKKKIGFRAKLTELKVQEIKT